MEIVRKFIHYFVLALVSFTRIPVRGSWLSSDQLSGMKPSKSMAFFPLIGALLGCICWIAWYLVKGFVPADALAFVLLVIPIILTGAYHEDGFADVFDSYGGYTRDQRLAIMKDSRVGAFGAIGITLLLLTKFILLKDTRVELMPEALIAALVLGRACAMIPFRIYPYIGQTSRNANLLAFGNATLFIALATSMGILYLFLGIKLTVLSFVVAQSVVLFSSMYFNRVFGGLTGDVGGALEQIGELSAYTFFMLLSYGSIHF